jgi:porin
VVAALRQTFVAAVACAALVAASAAHAESWLDRKYMTGDWGGLRSSLETQGVTIRAGHLSESAANPVGGFRQGAAYTQEVYLGADFDLDRLVGLAGGKLHVTFTERAGKSLANTAIGSIISVQEVFGAGQNVRLAELAYQQVLFDGRLTARLGWIHASDNFASSPIYCHFQNNGFCGQVGIVINSGYTIFPAGSWGGMLKLASTDEFYLQAGVYEVNPTLPLLPNGFKLGLSGATGVISMSQVGWQPRLGSEALPGSYRLGGYYDTSTAPWLGSPLGGPKYGTRGRWGVYAQADQMIHRTVPGSDRGLTAFAVAAYSGPDTAKLQYIWQAGLLQKGTFAGREHDTIGLGLIQSRISDQLVAAQIRANALAPQSANVQSAETTIELNYRAQLTPWFSLMPNIQYVMRPNAVTTIPNALVLGLQLKVIL